MKTTKIKILCLAVGVFSLLSFAACQTPAASESNAGESSSVEESAYELVANTKELLIFKAKETTETLSVYDALVTLQTEGKITFGGYTGDYGFTLTEVNGTKAADDWSTYWGVYTTLGSYDGVTYATEGYNDWQTGEYVDATYTYDGVKYLYASYGVSGLPVIGGYSYALRFIG
jgi:hypothetical protein